MCTDLEIMSAPILHSQQNSSGKMCKNRSNLVCLVLVASIRNKTNSNRTVCMHTMRVQCMHVCVCAYYIVQRILYAYFEK